MDNSRVDAPQSADLPIPSYMPVPTPAEKLRRKVGRMSDCLTRMLDQLGGDALGVGQLSYLTSQLTHLGHYYADAVAIVLHERTVYDVDRFDIAAMTPAEVAELTLPPSNIPPEIGGEA